MPQRGALGNEKQRIGSHSGKVTLLSWCAKYGAEKGTRRALGYHVPLKDRSVRVYSRDYQAAPMRKLAVVLAAVSDGSFIPDETRSGRFRKRKSKELQNNEEEEDPDDDDSDMLILSKLYGKMHKRVDSRARSICGRAEAGKTGFETFKKSMQDSRVKTVCGKRFPGESLESVLTKD